MIVLTTQQRESSTWLDIEQQLLARIAALQVDLENAKTWDDAQIVRGRLREIRGMMIAEQDLPKQEPDLAQLY